MNTHITKYTFGDMVYLKTDPEQEQRMVVRITLSPNGVAYWLNHGTTESCHFELEIAEEANELTRLGVGSYKKEDL